MGGDASVATSKVDHLQGALSLLVLKSLEHGQMHGWGITLHIQSISNEVLQVEEGSLYPALHRMEQEKWIISEWGLSENNRRARFYRLTALGRQQLSAERQHWQKITNAVAMVLEFTPA
jgi:PadR family transcriptional regulator, regulatory protein PadR